MTEKSGSESTRTNGEQPRVAQDKLVSSTRFIVFNRSAHVAAIAQKEHEQIYPQPGWVEHNAKEIGQHLGNWGCSSGIAELTRRDANSMCGAHAIWVCRPDTSAGESAELLTASALPYIGPSFAWLKNLCLISSDGSEMLSIPWLGPTGCTFISLRQP